MVWDGMGRTRRPLYSCPCWTQFGQRQSLVLHVAAPGGPFLPGEAAWPFLRVTHRWQAVGLPDPVALGLCRAPTWARNKAQCVIPAAVTMPPAWPCPPSPQHNTAFSLLPLFSLAMVPPLVAGPLFSEGVALVLARADCSHARGDGFRGKPGSMLASLST